MSYLIVYELAGDATEELRSSLQADHRNYLVGHIGNLVSGVGRMFSSDRSRVVGGYVLLDTDDVTTAEEFYDNDPYVMHGVWSSLVFGAVDTPGSAPVTSPPAPPANGAATPRRDDPTGAPNR